MLPHVLLPRRSNSFRPFQFICCRQFSELSEWEGKNSLSRALSRTHVDSTKHKKWSNQVKKWKPKWTQEPFEESLSFYKANYEFEALREIHKKSYQANVLLEIRDVRLPASSHHPSFSRLARHRTHLICYTHADMIDVTTRDRVRDWTHQSWPKSDCLFVDTRSERGDADFAPCYDWLLRHLESSGGVNAALTVGVPNTGKSSLLLALLRTAKQRKLIPKVTMAKKGQRGKGVRKAGPVGVLDTPGKTRTLTEYMIREKPRAYFLDVPGMTPPAFFFRERPEAWFAFGAANLLVLPKALQRDPDVQTSFCRYVLHCLNRDRQFQYVEKIGLEGPTNVIEDALEKLANKYKGRIDEGELRLKKCANFVKLFNTGNFGSVILDDIQRPYERFIFRDDHFGKGKEKQKRMTSGDDWWEERKERRSGWKVTTSDDWWDESTEEMKDSQWRESNDEPSQRRSRGKITTRDYWWDETDPDS
jgi:ribosome biogenesis GTPase A